MANINTDDFLEMLDYSSAATGKGAVRSNEEQWDDACREQLQILQGKVIRSSSRLTGKALEEAAKKGESLYAIKKSWYDADTKAFQPRVGNRPVWLAPFKPVEQNWVEAFINDKLLKWRDVPQVKEPLEKVWARVDETNKKAEDKRKSK